MHFVSIIRKKLFLCHLYFFEQDWHLYPWSAQNLINAILSLNLLWHFV